MAATSMAAQYPPGYLKENSRDSVRDVAITFIILVVAFVALRLYARRSIKKRFDRGDALILLAAVTCLTICIAAFFSWPFTLYIWGY